MAESKPIHLTSVVKTGKQYAAVLGCLVAIASTVAVSTHWTFSEFGLRPSEYLTVVGLEDWLNVTWTVLAVLALVHWTKVGGSRREFTRGFVALVFAFCLLFPIISADDDQLQIAFIADDSPSLAMDAIKSGKQLRNASGPIALAEVPRITILFPPATVLQAVEENQKPTSISVEPGATGNHSPPIA